MDKKDMKILRSSGEWSALYIDGKLARVGDHYIIDEHLYAMFNIEIEPSEDFLRGQDKRDGVAQTLEEVEQYRTGREEAQAKVARLRAEADALERRYGK